MFSVLNQSYKVHHQHWKFFSDVKAHNNVKSSCLYTVTLYHPEETSKNSDICDFLKVSDIENEW